MHTKSKNILSIATVFILILMLGIYLTPGEKSPSHKGVELSKAKNGNSERIEKTRDTSHQTGASLDSLKKILLEEIAARKRLEARLNEIELQLTHVFTDSGELSTRQDVQTPEQVTAPTTELNTDSNNWFNEEILLAQGLEQAQINRLRGQIEQMKWINCIFGIAPCVKDG
jgi:hypothetical protein